jgi:hypothetical protein
MKIKVLYLYVYPVNLSHFHSTFFIYFFIDLLMYSWCLRHYFFKIIWLNIVYFLPLFLFSKCNCKYCYIFFFFFFSGGDVHILIRALKITLTLNCNPPKFIHSFVRSFVRFYIYIYKTPSKILKHISLNRQKCILQMLKLILTVSIEKNPYCIIK